MPPRIALRKEFIQAFETKKEAYFGIMKYALKIILKWQYADNGKLFGKYYFQPKILKPCTYQS